MSRRSAERGIGHLVDIDEWSARNEVYAADFAASQPYPGRTAIAVAALPYGMRVEMTVTAVPPAGLPTGPTSS